MEEWAQDKSGIWHWRGTVDTSPGQSKSKVYDAAAKALDSRSDRFDRPSEPCWFWWLDTFCPMLEDDTVTALVERYRDWRYSFGCQCNVQALEDRLRQWSQGIPPPPTLSARYEALASYVRSFGGDPEAIVAGKLRASSESAEPTEAELIRRQLDTLRVACVRAYALGSRGAGGAAAGAIADAFSKIGLDDPAAYVESKEG